MSGAWSRLPPIVPALLLQAVAAVCTLLALLALRAAGIGVPLWLATLFCGVLATGLTRLAGLEGWWQIIQLLLTPGAVLLLRSTLPAWIYLALFVALLLVYWSTFRTRVPLYLSGPRVWQAVRDLLPPAQADRRLRVIDLGSGLGGLLMSLASQRDDAEFVGVELAPLPALVSKLRIALRRQRNCRVQWGSYWPADLAHYDVVFAFLSPVPMGALWEKARREMRGGTLFISSSFEVPGQTATRMVEVDDARGTKLHVWTM